MVEIKGSVILDTIKTVKLKYGEEIFKKIINLLDEEAKQIFEKKTILVTDWYPIETFMKFVETLNNLISGGDKEHIIALSEEILFQQLQGIYKIFIKPDSPEAIIKRVSAIHNTYFRGIGIEATLIGTGKARVKHIGFEKKHSLISLGIISFYKKALAMAGAKNIEIKYITPFEADKGFTELEITWSK